MDRPVFCIKGFIQFNTYITLIKYSRLLYSPGSYSIFCNNHIIALYHL
uniref:Mitogen-activated protein kinase kinase 2 n=1 Tax=Rhizophora mucronata TaxID=61149 RepID=A0A2P2LA75_RHIMU